jgi:succinate-acetate transporter protein
MGLRMRKSIRLAKGVRLNVGRKSASISVGNKYGHTTISTGSSRGSSSKGFLREDITSMFQQNVSAKKHKSDKKFLKVCGIIMMIVAAFALLMAIAGFCTEVPIGIFFSIPTVLFFLIGHFMINMSKH